MNKMRENLLTQAIGTLMIGRSRRFTASQILLAADLDNKEIERIKETLNTNVDVILKDIKDTFEDVESGCAVNEK